MGVFSVKARVWNPLNPKLSRDVELLVDTGATYTVLPEDLLKELGVKGVRLVKVRLASGEVVERWLGEVGIEVSGYRVSATPVIFGFPKVYLLGSVTMEQLGLMPDPIERRLRPIEVLMMGLK